MVDIYMEGRRLLQMVSEFTWKGEDSYSTVSIRTDP